MPPRTLRRTRTERTPAATTIRIWEDDPASTAATPIERPIPKLPTGRLKLTVDQTAPPAQPYEPGTAEFRYWVAVEALKRGVAFWTPLLPKGTKWQQGGPLAVRLDAGDKLNAFYNRASLTFFHSTVEGVTVFTGESPDVVTHELGHAILDAIRPQLWDAMSHEVAGFHESFGDISAILTALQLSTVRERFVAETSGRYRASRLSRVAEQLGWAVRQRRPCGVEPDCLRNAVNCFAYQSPSQLPIIAPAAMLSSEAHSFSRIFTGAFFEAFAAMVVTLSPQPSPDHILEASTDAGRLLVEAVRAAPIAPAYYAQVAGHLFDAAQTLFDGRYADAVEFGFMSRAILSAASVTAARQAGLARDEAAAAARRTTPPPAELPVLALAAREFGLGDRTVLVRGPLESGRLALAPSDLDGAPAPPASGEQAAREFLSELVMRDKVRLPGQPPTDPTAPGAKLQTHEIVDQGDALAVVRRLFDTRP